MHSAYFSVYILPSFSTFDTVGHVFHIELLPCLDIYQNEMFSFSFYKYSPLFLSFLLFSFLFFLLSSLFVFLFYLQNGAALAPRIFYLVHLLAFSIISTLPWLEINLYVSDSQIYSSNVQVCISDETMPLTFPLRW